MQAIVRRWDVEVLQAGDEEVLPALDAAPRRQHCLDVVRGIRFADVHKPSAYQFYCRFESHNRTKKPRQKASATSPSMRASNDAHRVTSANCAATSLVQQLDGIRADAEDLLHASRCFSELRRAQHGLELLQGPSCRAAEVIAEARRRVGECSAARAGSRAKSGAEGAQAHGSTGSARWRSVAAGDT